MFTGWRLGQAASVHRKFRRQHRHDGTAGAEDATVNDAPPLASPVDEADGVRGTPGRTGLPCARADGDFLLDALLTAAAREPGLPVPGSAASNTCGWMCLYGHLCSGAAADNSHPIE
jgi:hypothetical protein